jgi:hypothetical protein
VLGKERKGILADIYAGSTEPLRQSRSTLADS